MAQLKISQLVVFIYNSVVVRTESGNSWNLKVKISRPRKSCNMAMVVVSPGKELCEGVMRLEQFQPVSCHQ